MRTTLAALSLLLVMVSSAAATIVTKAIEYTHNGVKLEGYYAYDDAVTGPRPGMIVVHEWWGQNKFARDQAEELAKLGYAAFAVDMYGKGVTAGKAEDAQKLAAPFYADRKLMRERVAAGLKILLDQKEVVAAAGQLQQVGAIGFCFGGTVALELARAGAATLPAGAEFKALVTFHAGLSSVKGGEAKKGDFKPAVLVCHGADDPMVTDAEVKAFQEEMKAAGVDLQFNSYSGTVHAFTNPDADAFKIPGVKYNKVSAKLAKASMRSFLAHHLPSQSVPDMIKPATAQPKPDGTETKK